MNIAITGNYTDLYEIAMGQAYFLDGVGERRASFDYFFRRIPFGGGYVVFAGLDDVIDVLEDWHFTDEDIDYLTSRGFDPKYLAFLRNLRFRGSIHAPREGDVVFPTEPLLRVEGTVIEAQLVETMVLNLLNFESLIATKAARIRSVADDLILSEFGLRRAQATGGVLAARAAVIGGFDSTSNVYAAQKYGLRSEGTMAHSFIQWYEDELTAFRKFAAARPHDTVLLVDTYDTLRSGVPNAITTAHEMEAAGARLRAIRLDSGDLAFLSRRARAMLDEAGLDYVRIAASNQLDEYVIRSLRQQGAPIDIFGVGTSVVTGSPDSALDGVYKLALADGEPRIKVSEHRAKITLPGRKQVYRYFATDGMMLGADGIALADEGTPDRLTHPFDDHKSMRTHEFSSEPMLQPVMQGGVRVAPRRNVHDIRSYCAERLALLPPEYRRFENPHIYKVGISEPLRQLRDDLRRKHA
jgi:nicotinate phosphoribosyltransferase